MSAYDSDEDTRKILINATSCRGKIRKQNPKIKQSDIPDLNMPLHTEGQERRRPKKKVRDLNTNASPLSGSHVSAEMQEIYKFNKGPFRQSPGTNFPVYAHFQDNQELTVAKDIREFEEYQQFLKYYKEGGRPLPPYPVNNSGDSRPYGHAFSSSTPCPVGHSGSSGTHEDAAPSCPPHPGGNSGGSGSYKHAATPFAPNPEGHFKGSGSYGHAAPPSPLYHWGNAGASWYGYGK